MEQPLPLLPLSLPTCPACASANVKRNGHQSGKQRYQCKGCKKTWRDNPAPHGTDPQRKAMILAAYHERMSQRGLVRVFGVSRRTVGKWLKKSQEPAAPEPDSGAGPA